MIRMTVSSCIPSPNIRAPLPRELALPYAPAPAGVNRASALERGFSRGGRAPLWGLWRRLPQDPPVPDPDGEALAVDMLEERARVLPGSPEEHLPVLRRDRLALPG